MIRPTNIYEPKVQKKSVPLACLPKVRQTVKSFVKDGLTSSFITNEQFVHFGDEHQHFRDYGLQTIIDCQAVDLLQPFPAITLSPLNAADSADMVTLQIGRVNEQVKSLQAVEDAKAASVTDTPKTE